MSTDLAPLLRRTRVRRFDQRYLRAEWTKLRTAAGRLAALGIVAATVAVSVLVAAAMPCATGRLRLRPGEGRALRRPARAGGRRDPRRPGVGGEYGTGMIRGTLAAMPRRTGVLAAKAAVVTCVVAPAAAVAVTVSALAGRHILPAAATLPTVLRATGGSVLYLILIGLLAIGVAAVVRNAAAAVGVVLALLFLFPILAAAAPDPDWERHLLQVGPMTAGLAVQATTGLDKLPIGPWAGLGVTAAWAFGALLAGALALSARDA